MSLKILLAAEEAAGAQTLRRLAAMHHEIVGVLTDAISSGGGPTPVAALTAALRLQTLPAERLKDPAFAEEVQRRSVDLLLNVHSLHMVAEQVLNAPRIGSFNLHPGPLPEYAGRNNVGWAIYGGTVEYGVTAHWMVRRVDAGPIAFQERFDVAPDATALSLSLECARRGVRLVERVVEHAEQGAQAIPAVPQDLARRRYYSRIDVPQDGWVDWNRPVAEVARFARAFDYGPFPSPWGRPKTSFAGQQIEVGRLNPTDYPSDAPPGTVRLSRTGALEVACADRWIEAPILFLGGSRVWPMDVLALGDSGSGSRFTSPISIRERKPSASDVPAVMAETNEAGTHSSATDSGQCAA